MNIERALSVQGWMTEDELSYLASVASKSSIVAEVGSWMGRSTCALAANIGSGSVYAVDTWKGSQEHIPMLADKPEGWLFSQFRANTNGLPVMPIALPSLDAAFLIAKTAMRFDLIFIDACHSYESVKADLEAWLPLLAPGATICGHDYDPIYWPGIVQAVQECVPHFRVVPETTIWTTEAA